MVQYYYFWLRLTGWLFYSFSKLGPKSKLFGTDKVGLSTNWLHILSLKHSNVNETVISRP